MVDKITKKRVNAILEELKGQEFTSADVMSRLPKDRHLPTANELGVWLRCIAHHQSSTTTHYGYHVIWTVEE